MYNLNYFKENDKVEILNFIKNHPFAFLTGSTVTGKQVATQVPMFIEERDGKFYLTAHLMKNTDHHKAFLENDQVLAVFTGPHCYVSASWYTNPHTGSTWNYMSVHLSGKIKFLTEDALIKSLQKLSLHFEEYNTLSPTYYNNLAEDYVKKMLPAIAAFEIEVEEMDNVFKLSQNRDKQSYENIIHHLKQQNGDSKLIAEEMEKRKKELFDEVKE